MSEEEKRPASEPRHCSAGWVGTAAIFGTGLDSVVG